MKCSYSESPAASSRRLCRRRVNKGSTYPTALRGNQTAVHLLGTPRQALGLRPLRGRRGHRRVPGRQVPEHALPDGAHAPHASDAITGDRTWSLKCRRLQRLVTCSSTPAAVIRPSDRFGRQRRPSSGRARTSRAFLLGWTSTTGWDPIRERLGIDVPRESVPDHQTCSTNDACGSGGPLD